MLMVQKLGFATYRTEGLYFGMFTSNIEFEEIRIPNSPSVIKQVVFTRKNFGTKCVYI